MMDLVHVWYDDRYWSKNFMRYQGCGIPMPDLSDSGLFAGGQADFPVAFVRGQVNFGGRTNKEMPNFYPE